MAKASATPANQAAQVEGGGSMTINFADVPDETELPVVPRGIYPAVVDELTYGFSQSSGNPMWTWRFEISEGDHAGRKLFFHTPFVEAMLPRVKKVLSRVAPELLQGSFNPEQIANEGTMIGKACKIRIDIKPYEGKPRNNVRDVLESGGSEGSFL